MKTLKPKRKIDFISIVFILVGIALLANVLLLDLKGRTFFVDQDFKLEEGVSVYEENVYPSRGIIYDSDGNILATNLTTYKIIFILSDTHQKYVTDENGDKVLTADYVEDPLKTATLVSPLLDADEKYIYSRLTDEDHYQVEVGEYGNNLTYDTKCEIEALNLPGIYFESSTTRYYPYNTLACYLLGYTEELQDENGNYYLSGVSGIERILDEQLSGEEGYECYYSDPYGNPLSGGTIEEKEYQCGYNVKLTLNSLIQNQLEETLANTMALSTSPDKAWGIVMNAKSGAIYGYSSYPNFNLNTLNTSNFADHNSQLVYEPGSTFKTFIYSACADLGTLDPEATYDNHNFYVTSDENGKVARCSYNNGHVISNYNNYQSSSMDFYQAFCVSQNVGCATLLEKYIDQDIYIDYLDKFNFLKEVNVFGIDENGMTGTADFSNNFSIVTTTFGQGISVNALQLMQAYSVFGNGGIMIKPYVIESISNPDNGEIIYQGQREEVGRVISEDATDLMLYMLTGVINSGHSDTSYRYHLDNVTVAGKSGTAEVATESGGYGSTTIHSIMLMMPASDPEVLIYIAYQDDNEWTAQNISYIHKLEEVVANVLSLSDQQQSSEGAREVSYLSLENYINHSLTYVSDKAAQNKLELVVIGDGDSVVKQYPLCGSSIVEGQKLLVYTGGSITMPDMTGYSRDDLMAYWQLSGISIKISGSGFVTSQSIKAGELIDKDDVIEVVLN